MKMPNVRTALHTFSELPNAVGRPLSRAYMPELDGLRFVALLFVLLWHASIRATRYYINLNGDTHRDGYYSMLPHGEIGVLLFFFISGYVVSQPFLARPSADWKLKSFYIRRFIRIYPPYIIALSLCLLALQVGGHVPADAGSFIGPDIPLTSSYLASAFYVHSFIFNASSRLDPPIWSLEIEIVFYALAPLLLLAYTWIESRAMRVWSLSAIILALMGVTALAASQTQLDGRFRYGLLCHGYLFLLGILAADIAGDSLTRPRTTARWGDLLFLLGLTGFVKIGLHMTQVDARLSGGGTTFALELGTVTALALLFVGAFYGTCSARFLRSPWIRLIGTMCYSVYLTHIVAMQACAETLQKLYHAGNPVWVWAIHFLVLIPAGIVTGLVFYLCIERPFAALAASSGSRRRLVSLPAAGQGSPPR